MCRRRVRERIESRGKLAVACTGTGRTTGFIEKCCIDVRADMCVCPLKDPALFLIVARSVDDDTGALEM